MAHRHLILHRLTAHHHIKKTPSHAPSPYAQSSALISFAVAGVTGAVGSTLAAILRPLSHLKSLKSPLGWSHPKDHGLTGGDLLLSQARVHVAPVAAAATLAVGATSTVSTTARHFQALLKVKG